MHIFVYYLGVNVIFSKLIVSGVVLSWNFLANKFWTFSNQLKLFYNSSSFQYTEDITILIPAFNERSRIENTIQKIIDWQRKNSDLRTELIVVDDGSDDDTFNFIQNKFKSIRLYRVFKNIGKGGGDSLWY
jgi:cellulose synthase/poly-beta-1,6-N-acetylglucosamine synthase-like glycosyltransferase